MALVRVKDIENLGGYVVMISDLPTSFQPLFVGQTFIRVMSIGQNYFALMPDNITPAPIYNIPEAGGFVLDTTLLTTLGIEERLLEYYQSLYLFSWLRADSRTEALGKVTKYNDKVALVGVFPNARSIDPNHSFAQSNNALQSSAVVNNPNFSNKETSTFVLTNYYDSTIPSINWAFADDGTGCTIRVVHRRSTLGTNAVWATTAFLGGQTGSEGILLAAGSSRLTSQAAGIIAFLLVLAGGAPLSTTGVMTTSYINKVGNDGSVSWTGGSNTTGEPATPPSPVAPSGTMRIGARAGAGLFGYEGDLAEVLFANRVDPVLDAVTARYIFLRYGGLGV